LTSRRAVFVALALWALPATPQAGQRAQAGPEEIRARAWDALRSRLEEEKYLNHSLAVEAIMRELAATKSDDRDEWGLAGLLHDIDIGTTANDRARHGVAGANILRDLGFSAAVVHAVKAHDDGSGIARTSRLDHALHCADQVYWLILATGLRFPSDELDATVPEAIWGEMQGTPSKRAILVRVSTECAEIGFNMPRTVEAAHAALRRLSRAMAGR
jgi:putative nucleotidyltransferase with HDIG domain